MKSLAELQTRVAAWSRQNFGEQVSKYDGNTYGHLLPLLGVAEEYFECCQASKDTNFAEEQDALADVTIYLCDFTHRLGIPLQDDWDSYTTPPVKAWKELFHSTLKMHQGIRGYDDHDYARKCISHAAHSVVASMNDLFVPTDTTNTVVDLAAEVFDKVVSKRDWVANPTNAHEET